MIFSHPALVVVVDRCGGHCGLQKVIISLRQERKGNPGNEDCPEAIFASLSLLLAQFCRSFRALAYCVCAACGVRMDADGPRQDRLSEDAVVPTN